MEINNALSCSKFVYPVARRDETAVDDYHGQKVMFTFQLHNYNTNNSNVFYIITLICSTKSD